MQERSLQKLLFVLCKYLLIVANHFLRKCNTGEHSEKGPSIPETNTFKQMSWKKMQVHNSKMYKFYYIW